MANILFTEENSPFHVTCVFHNARTSFRMIDFKLKKGLPEYLSIIEEEKLIEIICNHIFEFKLVIISLNICADHIHFILVSSPANLTNLVGRLKSISSREFNIWRGITIPDQSRELNGNVETRGHAPLSTNRGATQNSFWAQKFNRVEITCNSQLENTINYILFNRIKHNLMPLSQKAQNLISKIISKDVFTFE